MSHTLQYRRMDFRFDDEPVPFHWNPANPAFSVLANAVSFVAVAWERYITAAVKDVVEMIDDEQVRAEARMFLAQEAQHAAAHRAHVRALCRTYPGLEQPLRNAIARFDTLREKHPPRWHAAYMANIEATFPALFGLLIDHREELFADGDTRVASLMLWHFMEEIEHRSAALEIYDAVVGERWYRSRLMISSLQHMGGLLAGVLRDFREVLPADLVDVLVPEDLADLGAIGRREITARVRRRRTEGNAFAAVSDRRLLGTLARIARSQTPFFRPDKEPLPAAYGAWMAAYESGADMTRDYGRPAGTITDPVAAR